MPLTAFISLLRALLTEYSLVSELEPVLLSSQLIIMMLDKE